MADDAAPPATIECRTLAARLLATILEDCALALEKLVDPLRTPEATALRLRALASVLRGQ